MIDDGEPKAKGERPWNGGYCYCQRVYNFARLYKES